MSKIETSFLTSPSGAKLHTYICRTSSTPKAIIHINHGMCEHAGRYQRFMQFLAKHGYHSIAQDHRGHGKTQAQDAPQGVFAKHEGWAKVIADTHLINAYAREKMPNLPIVCFGHSMGATIATSYMLRYPQTISAAAIWNAAMTGIMPALLSFVMKVERALKGSDTVSTLANTLTFEAWNKEFKPNRTASDWLSQDEVEVDKYIADPDCGFDARIGLWIDLLGGLADTAKIKHSSPDLKTLSVHLLGGDQDPCSNKGKSATQLETRLLKAGLSDVSKVILQGARHESLNEINRNEIMADFVDWLNERFQTNSSG